MIELLGASHKTSGKVLLQLQLCGFCLKVPAQTVEQKNNLLNTSELMIINRTGLENSCLTLHI